MVVGGSSGWQMRMLHECFRGKQRAELSSPTLGLLKMELGNMCLHSDSREKAVFYSTIQRPDKWEVEERSRG